MHSKQIPTFPDLRLWELASEPLTDTRDDLGKPLHLLGSKPSIAKRYAEGQVAAHLHLPRRFFFSIPGDSEPCCAVLYACPLGSDECSTRRRHASLFHVLNQPFDGLPRVGHDLLGYVEDVVLVRDGEFVEDGEGMSRGIVSVVRLRPLDECPMFGTQVGNASVSHSIESGLRLFNDRELGLVIGAAPVKQRDLPHEMVEGGAQVVDGVAEDHAKAHWRFLSDLETLDPFPGVRIEPSDREYGVRFLVEEGIHLGPEFVELLFCPVVLSLDAV